MPPTRTVSRRTTHVGVNNTHDHIKMQPFFQFLYLFSYLFGIFVNLQFRNTPPVVIGIYDHPAHHHRLSRVGVHQEHTGIFVLPFIGFYKVAENRNVVSVTSEAVPILNYRPVITLKAP